MQKGLGWSWRPWPQLTWNSRNISLSFLDICSQPYHGLWLRQACVLMAKAGPRDADVSRGGWGKGLPQALCSPDLHSEQCLVPGQAGPWLFHSPPPPPSHANSSGLVGSNKNRTLAVQGNTGTFFPSAKCLQS